MTKNYFTDSQVKDIAHKVDGYGLVEGGIFLNKDEFKTLMNLAVEAAIGQKLAFRVEHFDGGYELSFNETWQKVKEQLPLYSVKELES